MSKHTPGPWEVVGGGIEGDGVTIAEMIDQSAGDDWQANARLIAAAPEMLAWFRAFVGTLEHHNADTKLSFTDSVLNSDILDALSEARALLARIEGGKV